MYTAIVLCLFGALVPELLRHDDQIVCPTRTSSVDLKAWFQFERAGQDQMKLESQLWNGTS